MIERNLLDQTKDLRGPQRMVQSNPPQRMVQSNPPQRMVQSNFGMEEQRRIAEQELSQNNRVGRKATQNDAQPIQDRNNRHFDVSGPIRAGGGGSIGMPANPDGRVYAGGSPGLYAPGGKFFRGSGSIVMRPVPPDQMQDNNPSQTYQNQENRSFSNSYGNSYNNSMSGYQPQYGSRGGFGMQQPMYGGGMGIMGLQSPFGGYGMQSPFGGYSGGMQQPMYGGGMQSPFGSYGMQQPMYGGMQQGYGMQSPYGGYGMQQPQYQSSPFSPQFGGGIGSMFPGMGGGYGGGMGGGNFGGNYGGNYGGNMGGGYGQQPPSYGGMGGGFNQRPMPIRQIEGPAMMQTQGPENLMRPQTPIITQMTYGGEYGGYNTQRDYDQQPQTQPGPAMMLMPQMRTM
jgi:hypothetical protein